MRWTTDPHPGRQTRDVELLRWTTSSGKRLRLGSGEVADGGGWGFAAGAERLWRHCGDGAAAIDEAIVGAAPWRWRTGRLNRRDEEMDDGSSSGEVDEGRRAVAVDEVVGEEASAG